jgi:hypothetical protein
MLYLSVWLYPDTSAFEPTIFMKPGIEGEPNATFFSFLQTVITIWQMCELLKQE